MELIFKALTVHTFAAGLAGLLTLWYAAAFKLSTESIDSPRRVTRWIYRYLIFSFCFFVAFLFIAPVTTWQLIKLPAIGEFGRNHPWLLFALTVPPAAIFYYLHRKFVIWCDPVKIKARKRGARMLFGSGR